MKQLPRAATQTEQFALFNYLLSRCQETPSREDRDECAMLVIGARLAVFDHFMPDCPGYTGRILFAVFSAGPEAFEVFTFDKEGKLERVRQDVAAEAKP